MKEGESQLTHHQLPLSDHDETTCVCEFIYYHVSTSKTTQGQELLCAKPHLKIQPLHSDIGFDTDSKEGSFLLTSLPDTNFQTPSPGDLGTSLI